jgi:thioredoxin 1
MKKTIEGILICVVILVFTIPVSAQEQGTMNNRTVESVYPGLASGALAFATLRDLPDPIIMRSGDLKITSLELNNEIAKASQPIREQLLKNQFFLLEQLATRELILRAATQNDPLFQKNNSGNPEEEVIQNYFKELVSKTVVTNQEIVDFFTENKDLFGGATFDQVRTELETYVLQQKQQEVLDGHIRTFGKRKPIFVSAAWTKKQALFARENSVDNARSSGLPSLVDFGASGCRPCDMMAPILAELKKKYEGRLNVLFIHVREEQILAARYGIQTIPVQVFFNKNGKEIYRHTGFFAQNQIEKKIAELGVK